MHFIQIFIEDIINPALTIAFALFVGVGYILTTMYPVPIDHWVTVFYLAIIIALLGVVVRVILNRERYSMKGFFDIRIFLPLIPLVIFLPAIDAEFSPDPMLQILSHGDIHLGYIYQLMYGTTPLDNVFIAGYPANYYWLYHAFVAAIAQITWFAPASIASAVNIVALLSSLLWTGKTLVAIGVVRHRTLMVGLLAVFVIFSVNISGILHGGPNLLNEPYDLNLLRTMLIDGADRRLHSVLPKFFEFTSTSLGFMLFSAAMYACVKLLQNQFDFLHLFLISAAGIGTLAVQQLETVYIVLSLIVATVLIIFFSLFLPPDKRSFDFSKLWQTIKHPINILTLLVWLVISLGLSLPLMQYNVDISYNYETRTLFSMPTLDNLNMMTTALYLLFPLYILHVIWVAWKPRIEEVFFVLSTALAIGVTLSLSFIDSNQYKGVFTVAMLMAISVLCLLKAFRGSSNWLVKLAGYLVLVAFLVLSFSSLAYVSFYLYKQPESQPYKGFYYEKNRFNFTYEGDKRIPAYRWIRNNAPSNAVIITPTDVLKFSHIIHQHVVYVRPGQFEFTSNIAEYDVRMANVDKLYQEDLSLETYQSLIQEIIASMPDRPIYAVIRGDEISQEMMEQIGTIQVYTHDDNKGGHVYLLNP